MRCVCCLYKVIRWRYPFIERDAGKVSFIRCALGHRLRMAGLAAPQQCLLFAARQEQGQSGAPGTCSDYSDTIGRSVQGI